MEKNMKSDPGIKENCCKEGQKQHRKTTRQKMCNAPSMSTIRPASETTEKEISAECPICMDSLSNGMLCSLPCKHDFHQECVEELWKRGVLQACPLCRAALPVGPDELFEDGVRLYATLTQKVDSGKTFWHRLTASKTNRMMAEVVAKWTAAADQGHVIAQNNLGFMYRDGKGVSQDLEEAARWTQKAADQGYVIAQNSLGAKYSDGLGVPQDLKEATRWFRKAADQGHANAQYNLGVVYWNGEGGVSQDHTEAVQWFQKAADQGCADALSALIEVS